MPFSLDQIVPWGRSLDEYRDMFSLSDIVLGGRILGCGDGPASFNAERTESGGRVVSIDPIYCFTPGQIDARIREVAPVIIKGVEENRTDFVWDRFKSPEVLLQQRMAAMEHFLKDFEQGKGQGRYVSAEAQCIPFPDDTFDLALSSHFLLLYGKQFSYEDHFTSITELLRVSRELRIFPVLELGNAPSRHLERLATELAEAGYNLHIETVNYEFQVGANQMAVIRR